jgi:DNA-binding NarL/FixJ family response regulator
MHATSCSSEPPARQRIVIVDDHALMRHGLTVLIDNEPDLVVCAAVDTPREGLEAIAISPPDLVIADLSLARGDGLAMVKDIRAGHQYLPILVLTMHDSPVWVRRAFQAGASGYVSKQEMSETLLVAIRCVLDGERYLSARMSLKLDAN